VAGLAVYRASYRARLIEAMRETFTRTARLVGDEAFHQAAAHHLVTHPPSGWTLDLVGEGFDLTCCDLFADDNEVGEIAWLEWAMHRCFAAANAHPMTAAQLSELSDGFDPPAWARLRFGFAPGLALHRVRYDLVRLWQSLADVAQTADIALLDAPGRVAVRREGERPVFVRVDQHEALALAAMMNGASFGDACEALADAVGEAGAAQLAGASIGRWLGRGWVARIDA
jgi:hypothetical protein